MKGGAEPAFGRDGVERRRLDEQYAGTRDWQAWGPYLSERQWGTVREDYSAEGTAWSYLPHDHARSRAYRWGEDGIAGFSDDRQALCLSLALWNGRDPILKERLFGLTNDEGNHGEDVKELYHYLDAVPSHAYLKMLYKYPQGEFPYAALVAENARRGTHEPEHELLDTGIFDDDRYFDVVVEYAQGEPGDVLMHITATNRGPGTARLHLLPQLVFRNTWSWRADGRRPGIEAVEGVAEAVHARLGRRYLQADGEHDALYCDNETNGERLFGLPPDGGFPKDAIHARVVRDEPSAVNPAERGTKVALWFRRDVPPGGECTVRVRLGPERRADPFGDADALLATRRREADDYYDELQAAQPDADARAVQRQAFAGMIWSKQFYHFDVRRWLDGDPVQPPPPSGRTRDEEWRHLNNADVMSMPDTWEYPWYAAWDLAFHCLPLAIIDPAFAKNQLVLLTREWFMHPNGQLPAYEWAFGDVNPPVHAWAALRVFEIDRERSGRADHAFLERVFHKLLINFTWWVNRKDVEGRNIFQGGFLGLDNIGVFDRSAPLPTGGFIDQADGTGWMAMYCLNLMRIALELALQNPVYEDIATKFFEHFLEIAGAMDDIGGRGVGLWDDADEFHYDVLHLPDGELLPMKVRSMVGLVPLFAVETIDGALLDRLPGFARRLDWFLRHRPDLARLVSRWNEPGKGDRRLLSLLRGHRMKCVLRRMLDETEFLSEFGVRSLSKAHADAPYVFERGGTRMTVAYEPAESTSGTFGGNSNWRGPIWFPVNFLVIESLTKFHHYYGDDFRIECPTGSGTFLSIGEVADELSRRLCRLFLKDEAGHRAVFSQYPKLRDDPRFRDHLLFHEYFDGDTGRGVGASHQTGWTGLVASLLHRGDPAAPGRGGPDASPGG